MTAQACRPWSRSSSAADDPDDTHDNITGTTRHVVRLRGDTGGQYCILREPGDINLMRTAINFLIFV